MDVKFEVKPMLKIQHGVEKDNVLGAHFCFIDKHCKINQRRGKWVMCH